LFLLAVNIQRYFVFVFRTAVFLATGFFTLDFGFFAVPVFVADALLAFLLLY
jgi:hypothetical protein